MVGVQRVAAPCASMGTEQSVSLRLQQGKATRGVRPGVERTVACTELLSTWPSLLSLATCQSPSSLLSTLAKHWTSSACREALPKLRLYHCKTLPLHDCKWPADRSLPEFLLSAPSHLRFPSLPRPWHFSHTFPTSYLLLIGLLDRNSRTAGHS